VAWLLPLSLPLLRLGEVLSSLELELPDEVAELSDEVEVSEEVDVLSAAYATAPTATVPATLAATKAPVISDARRIPVSRFICVAPLSLMTQLRVPSGSRTDLCGSFVVAVNGRATQPPFTDDDYVGHL
jgi:hypothetical protein